jgi:hypothetical protein
VAVPNHAQGGARSQDMGPAGLLKRLNRRASLSNEMVVVVTTCRVLPRLDQDLRRRV